MVLGLGCKSEEEGGRGCIFPRLLLESGEIQRQYESLESGGKARVRVGVS